jgi:hypothetical protein
MNDCKNGIHNIFFKGERLYVCDSTIWLMASEIMRLDPLWQACPRCDLPMIHVKDDGEPPYMACPGVCDTQKAISSSPEWDRDGAASGWRWRLFLGTWELMAYDDGRWEARHTPSCRTLAHGEEKDGEAAKQRAMKVHAALTSKENEA